MAVRITHIRLSSWVESHEHITDVQWLNESVGNTGANSRASMVEWIDVKKGTAYVGSGLHKAYVGVVTPEGRSPYLRSYADKEWNNNLLSLPHF
jgi:hypothetical protein